FDSFKAGMTELGYIEGKNVTYIYHGASKPEAQVIASEVRRLIDQKVDLLFTIGNLSTIEANRAVQGTTLPVVFAPVVNPVGTGVVASLAHPGGNVTGIQAIDNTPKALEWLLKFVPGTPKVYVPYTLADQVSVTSVQPLPAAAAQLGVELMLDPVRSPDEAR